MMKLHPAQLDRLAQGLVNRFHQEDFIVVHGDDDKLKGAIGEALRRNFAEEERLEKEAWELMASHAGEGRHLDTHKAMLLIKQRLAQKRGFVL